MEWDHLGTDLDLGFVATEDYWLMTPATRVDLTAEQVGGQSPRASDLKLTSGISNLVQDLFIRLQSHQGELTELGFAQYGSRHHELIGMPNTETNRNRIKIHILNCLRQEKRLAKILRVEVKPVPGNVNREKVKVEIEALVKGMEAPFSFVVPFSFAGPFDSAEGEV